MKYSVDMNVLCEALKRYKLNQDQVIGIFESFGGYPPDPIINDYQDVIMELLGVPEDDHDPETNEGFSRDYLDEAWNSYIDGSIDSDELIAYMLEASEQDGEPH